MRAGGSVRGVDKELVGIRNAYSAVVEQMDMAP